MNHLVSTARSLLTRLSADQLRAEVTRNLSISSVVKVMSVLASLLQQLVLARMLGLEQFGIYTFVWATFLTLSIVGRLGFGLAAIRFVADYRSREEIALLKGFIQRARQMVMLASALTGITAFAVILLIRNLGQIDVEVMHVLVLALPLLPFYALSELHVGMLRGADRLLPALGTHNVIFPLAVIIFISLSVLLTPKPTAVTAISASFLALLITLGCQYFFLRKAIDSGSVKEKAAYQTRTWLSVASTMMLGSGFAQILNQMDILVVGSFIGTAASGIYSVAARFANLVSFGLQISNQSTAHMYTPLYVNGQMQKLQRVVSLTVLIAMITTVPIVAVLFIWPSQTLALFGEAFSEQGATILQVLLFGQFVHVVSGPNGLLMQMTNYQNEMALIQLATLVFDVALLVALVPTFGLLGVAVATASATVFRNLVITVRVQRHLGINPTAFSRHLLRG